MGVFEGRADECSMRHDGNPRRNPTVILIQRSYQVHVPAYEEQLLREIDGILHDLPHATLHLLLHLDHIYITHQLPLFYTFLVRSLSLL